MRLYLLGLIVNSSVDDDPCDVDLVKRWQTLSDVVSGLGNLGLVSSMYDRRHLLVDVWYLYKRCSDSPPDYRSSMMEYESNLVFRIVVQSLLDLRSGRPCDFGLWLSDEPPDHKKCMSDEHFCYPHADKFFENFEETDIEAFIHVPNGSVSGIVRKIKRDPIFRIESLFSQRLRTFSSTLTSFVVTPHLTSTNI